jgi:hypothetical protein
MRNKAASQPARGWDRLSASHPDVAAAYRALRRACDRGPLAKELIALVKLAVSVGAKAERTMHAHTSPRHCGTWRWWRCRPSGCRLPSKR